MNTTLGAGTQLGSGNLYLFFFTLVDKDHWSQPASLSYFRDMSVPPAQCQNWDRMKWDCFAFSQDAKTSNRDNNYPSLTDKIFAYQGTGNKSGKTLKLST